MRLKQLFASEKDAGGAGSLLFFISLLFIFYMFLIGSCETVVTGKELAQEYYNLGNAYYEVEKYEDAVFFYNKAIHLNNLLNYT